VLPMLEIDLFFNAEPMYWLNVAPAIRFYIDSILPSILAIVLLCNRRPTLGICRARHTIVYRFNIAVNIDKFALLYYIKPIYWLNVTSATCAILYRVHIAANIYFIIGKVLHTTSAFI
jgi:hypothetical protein